MSQSHRIATALIALPALLLGAGNGHDHGAKGPPALQGGKVHVAGAQAFEVTFLDSGLHIFPMRADGTPVVRPGITGQVVLKSRRGKPTTLTLEPVVDAEGRVTHLRSLQDFSTIRDGSRRATFSLRGLEGGEASFSSVLRRTPGANPAKPAKAGSHNGHDMAGSHNGRTKVDPHKGHDMAGSHSSKKSPAPAGHDHQNHGN